MNTKTFLASQQEINEIKKKYALFSKKSNNPYVVFWAKNNNTTITIYNSNKVVIQSKDVLEPVITNKQKSDISEQFIIGSDEVGCGDIFGPIVCAAVVIKNISEYQQLKNLNIQDSKKLREQKIISLAQEIISKKLCEFSVYSLNNNLYNQLILSNNQNQLKMFVHIQSRSKIKSDLKWVLDQFSTPKSLELYQKNLFKNNLISQQFSYFSTTKAESKYLAVATSSIIARYYFLRKMHVLSQNANETLLLGASNKTLFQYQKLKSKIDMENYAKLNFKSLK